MSNPEHFDSSLRETSKLTIKVKKINFPKTNFRASRSELALIMKLFLYRVNSAKALRRQKVTNGYGSRIPRFKRNMHDRSATRFYLFQVVTSFRHFRNGKNPGPTTGDPHIGLQTTVLRQLAGNRCQLYTVLIQNLTKPFVHLNVESTLSVIIMPFGVYE